MIKILFFIESLAGGGAEKVLCNLVNAMDFSKFDITVQTLYPDAGAEALAPEIHYKWCYSSPSRANTLRMRLETALGLTYPLHIKGSYDIEIAYLECGSTKIMAGSTNQNAVKLAWVHCDLAKKSDDSAEFVRKTAKHYQKFDRIICVSEDVRNSFIQMYGSGFKTETLYNCYNDKEIRLKAEQSLSVQKPSVPVCAAIGRLTSQKGFDRLLRVHNRLIQEGVQHQLWILGEGPDRAELENYITKNHLEDSVTLYGFQNNPYPFIKAADFLVCSSRYEGFSTVAVEGMILGQPMVTTACTGMDEIFGCSEYGLIAENSEGGVYQGLRRMLTEPGLLEYYKHQASLRGNDFCRDNLVKKTEEFLLNL